MNNNCHISNFVDFVINTEWTYNFNILQTKWGRLGGYMSKRLIAFYSRAGENYFSGEVRRVEKGNCEKLVKHIAEKVDADVFRIEMETPYSEDYLVCTEEAKADLDNGARPKLLNTQESIDEYDDIILVYPNYWGSIPMVLYTWGEHLNWTGKKVYPVCSSEGSGFGNTVSNLRKLCTGAKFVPGYTVNGSDIEKSGNLLNEWLEDAGLV